MAGQALIHASELRSVVTEYTNYKAATHNFKEKYFAWPGDMTDATTYWGDNTTHCSDAGIPNGTPGTCNGDGNGTITKDAANAAEESEGHMFWQHLANAGMIEGSFTGIAGSQAVSDDVIGENVPASAILGTGWGIDNFGNGYGGSGEDYAGDYGRHHFEFGRDDSSDHDTDDPALKPEDAWNIDKKIDDGHPAYGVVRAKYWDDACSAANDGGHAQTDLDASYKLTDESVQCALHFLFAD